MDALPRYDRDSSIAAYLSSIDDAVATARDREPVRRELYEYVVAQPGAVSREQAADGLDVLVRQLDAGEMAEQDAMGVQRALRIAGGP